MKEPNSLLTKAEEDQLILTLGSYKMGLLDREHENSQRGVADPELEEMMSQFEEARSVLEDAMEVPVPPEEIDNAIDRLVYVARWMEDSSMERTVSAWGARLKERQAL